MDETNKLDIKDFPSLSSAPETSNILLALQTGAPGKMTIALFKTMVKRDVSPSIKDGLWWIGEVNTEIRAAGKNPIFRKGTSGIEWRYDDATDDAWTVVASYDSIKLRYDDLTSAQRADIISLDNMTAAEIARLQQPANDMIAILTQTNSTSVAAEALRVEKESARVVEENKRVAEEGKRVSAEDIRAKAESIRQQKEEARLTDESSRLFKETERIKEETARIQKEGSRQSGEEARVVKENERVAAESERAGGESARKEAENTRVGAENIRIAAEESRAEEYVKVIAQTNEAKGQANQATKEANEAIQKAVSAAAGADSSRDGANAAAAQALSAAGSVDAAKNLAVQAAEKADESAGKADAAVLEADSARDRANASALAAKEIAEHQPYIGEDYYFYQWNLITKSYDKTSIYTKGEGFSIFRSYTSIELMNADKGNVPQGRFVMINTNDVENPDNAQVYFRNETSETGFDFVVDMSGAVGFTGKTPQFVVGNITTGVEGSAVAASLSENGVDEGGNPIYAINLSVPRGDKGKVPEVSMGTVTTVAPGTSASASLVPDGQLPDGSPKYKLNLSIPKGEEGSLAAGDAKDLTVTFVESTERINVESGDSFSVILGKVRKWFSDLKKVAFTGKFSDLVDKPTTVDEYGITDASKTGHKHGRSEISDFPSSMPASDVSTWAKQPNKPEYSASEVGASPENHNHEGTYEPKFEKNSAFNKAFGNTSGSACEGDDSRLSNARPASDVPQWAKQVNKPSYSASEVGALPGDHAISGTAHQDIRDSIVSYLAIAKGYADTKIASLIGSAPEILDTLGELAEAILNNQSVVNAINNAISQKLGQTEAQQLYVAIQGYVAYSQEEKNKLSGLSNYDDSALRDKFAYYEGANSTSTLTGLPVNKRLITASLASATNISLAAGMTVGRELVISITPTANFNQPIPIAGGWSSLDGDKIGLSVGKITEISILCVAASNYVVSSKTS